MAKIKAAEEMLPKQVGSEATAEFQKNFARQRFFSDEAWVGRNRLDKGRGILINKGMLRGAIDFVDTVNKARVFVKAPADKYAGLHNNGGVVRVTITTKMRKWAWAMFRETGDTMYRAIALTKKSTIAFTMPKRQFIGKHPDLDKHILEFIEDILRETI